jgi:DNA-directed RNA polymerase II subunit RPB2
MLAHGASAFTKDRLFDVSDPYSVTICAKCGQITHTQDQCTACSEDDISSINIPYAAKQLVHSLHAMGMKTVISATK